MSSNETCPHCDGTGMVPELYGQPCGCQDTPMTTNDATPREGDESSLVDTIHGLWERIPEWMQPSVLFGLILSGIGVAIVGTVWLCTGVYHLFRFIFGSMVAEITVAAIAAFIIGFLIHMLWTHIIDPRRELLK